jgi:hypothetical protein
VEVVAHHGSPLAVGARRRGRGDPGRNTRARSALGDEVALGDELRVGFHHNPARDAQLGRERPAGRQPSAREQAPGAHAVAQRALELRMKRGAAVAVEG